MMHVGVIQTKGGASWFFDFIDTKVSRIRIFL